MQEQIEEMREDIRTLKKMNDVLSGKLYTIIKSIDSLSSRIDDVESLTC